MKKLSFKGSQTERGTIVYENEIEVKKGVIGILDLRPRNNYMFRVALNEMNADFKRHTVTKFPLALLATVSLTSPNLVGNTTAKVIL